MTSLKTDSSVITGQLIDNDYATTKVNEIIEVVWTEEKTPEK